MLGLCGITSGIYFLPFTLVSINLFLSVKFTYEGEIQAKSKWPLDTTEARLTSRCPAALLPRHMTSSTTGTNPSQTVEMQPDRLSTRLVGVAPPPPTPPPHPTPQLHQTFSRQLLLEKKKGRSYM